MYHVLVLIVESGSSGSSSGGLSNSVIGGIIGGVVVAIVIIILLVMVIVCMRRSKSKLDKSSDSNESIHGTYVYTM